MAFARRGLGWKHADRGVSPFRAPPLKADTTRHTEPRFARNLKASWTRFKRFRRRPRSRRAEQALATQNAAGQKCGYVPPSLFRREFLRVEGKRESHQATTSKWNGPGDALAWLHLGLSMPRGGELSASLGKTPTFVNPIPLTRTCFRDIAEKRHLPPSRVVSVARTRGGRCETLRFRPRSGGKSRESGRRAESHATRSVRPRQCRESRNLLRVLALARKKPTCERRLDRFTLRYAWFAGGTI